MKILHVVPGLDVIGNGIAVAAKLLAGDQNADIIDTHKFIEGDMVLASYDEVWVHSCWLPMTLKACWRVLRAERPLVRMIHANLDPVRLHYHGWKKWLVGLFDRFLLRRCTKIVATCVAEKSWIQSYLGEHCPPVEVTDIKRFFKLTKSEVGTLLNEHPLHLLYLGRQHPLKGLACLEEAVKGIEGVELRVVSNAFGEEKERVWEWCDALVLPTLSENFGLVIAEALERGKRVITTDGAPAWGDGNDYGGRLVYLKGYRDGTDEDRIQLLNKAIKSFCEGH